MENKKQFIQAIGKLSREARVLFHRLKAVGEQIHHEKKISMGERAILEEISKDGPKTVPQMARCRPVSRQHIQKLINSLQEEGYVELVENPDHKRSSLVNLTPEGEACFQSMQKREVEVLSQINFGLKSAEILEAAEVLGKVRKALEGPQMGALLEKNTN